MIKSSDTESMAHCTNCRRTCSVHNNVTRVLPDGRVIVRGICSRCGAVVSRIASPSPEKQ